jgi:hypothetical protein
MGSTDAESPRRRTKRAGAQRTVHVPRHAHAQHAGRSAGTILNSWIFRARTDPARRAAVAYAVARWGLAG